MKQLKSPSQHSIIVSLPNNLKETVCQMVLRLDLFVSHLEVIGECQATHQEIYGQNKWRKFNPPHFLLIDIIWKDICNFTHDNISTRIDFMNLFFHSINLISIDHKINYGFRPFWITTRGIHTSNTTSKYIT